jgi:hypothetical protein
MGIQECRGGDTQLQQRLRRRCSVDFSRARALRFLPHLTSEIGRNCEGFGNSEMTPNIGVVLLLAIFILHFLHVNTEKRNS